MRQAIILAVLAGFTAARPFASPQAIDFTQFDDATPIEKTGPPIGALTDYVDYSPSAAAASAAAATATDPAIAKRATRRSTTDDCAAQSDGYAPVSTPDTASTFLLDPQYDNIADSVLTPDGYSLAFSGLQGATEGNGYLGLYTLQSFSTIQCQQYCDAAPNCFSFNLYIERDPSVNPADACPDPASIGNYKCTLWGYQITESSASNTGQWRDQFQVAISGSNGYNKLAPPSSYTNFTGPVEQGGATQAPSSYMGYKYYSGPYDPSQCAASCQETTAWDHDHPRSDGTYDACNFFNAYVLSENGVPQGTYCSMYTQSWDKSYSTNMGQYRGSDYYSVSQSYTYTLATQDPGTV